MKSKKEAKSEETEKTTNFYKGILFTVVAVVVVVNVDWNKYNELSLYSSWK